MPAAALGHRRSPVPATSSAGSRADGFRRVWAATLSTSLGVLFAGVTAVTVTMWATDPTYGQSNPVVDLAFLSLGGILVTTGLASQFRREPEVAGLQQAVLALVALAGAGWLGGRIEPMVGALVLLVAATPLVMLHPDRPRLLQAAGAGADRALLAMAAVALGPMVVYAHDMLDRARTAGPSCFLGQCVEGDRYAEAAALAVAVVLVALLASARTPGWRLPAWSAGIAAVVFGAAALLWPGEVGAIGGVGAVATLVWGCAVVGVAHRPAGQPRPTR